jgi:broad specificity phosphatase PhoE
MSSEPADAPPTATAPAAGTVRVLLLRHGQSEWNAVQRWQGTADSPLTALGREQAIETAWTLAGIDTVFDALWSSDLSRAAETAAIIGDALALGAPRIDGRLREAHAGEWEGMTPSEIEAGWPGWLDQHHRPPSFESYHAVVERATGALRHIAADASERAGDAPAAAVVVTHSGLIRSVIRHLGTEDERVPNLGGVWLIVDPTAPSAASGASSTVDHDVGIELHDVFDPAGIVISGIDAPGEDPGEESDQPDTHGRAQH